MPTELSGGAAGSRVTIPSPPKVDRDDGETVHKQIVNALFGMLRSGSYKVGDRLPGELILVQTLGVGRSAVREAIRELVAFDVLEVQRGKGTYVRSARPDLLLSAEYLRDDALAAMRDELLEVRLILEPEAAALAAERCSTAHAARLESDVRQLASAAAAHQYAPAGTEFHLDVALAAGNRALWRVAQAVTGFHTLGAIAKTDDVVAHHEILNAITSRDPGGARTAMRRHLETLQPSLPSASYVVWSGAIAQD